MYLASSGFVEIADENQAHRIFGRAALQYARSTWYQGNRTTCVLCVLLNMGPSMDSLLYTNMNSFARRKPERFAIMLRRMGCCPRCKGGIIKIQKVVRIWLDRVRHRRQCEARTVLVLMRAPVLQCVDSIVGYVKKKNA